MTRYKKLRGETDTQYEKRTAILKSQRNVRRRNRRKIEKILKAIRKREAELAELVKVEKRKIAKARRIRARLWREAGREH
jgi:hypothetical protein